MLDLFNNLRWYHMYLGHGSRCSNIRRETPLSLSLSRRFTNASHSCAGMRPKVQRAARIVSISIHHILYHINFKKTSPKRIFVKIYGNFRLSRLTMQRKSDIIYIRSSIRSQKQPRMPPQKHPGGAHVRLRRFYRQRKVNIPPEARHRRRQTVPRAHHRRRAGHRQAHAGKAHLRRRILP